MPLPPPVTTADLPVISVIWLSALNPPRLERSRDP
jgi:hypothetical protein